MKKMKRFLIGFICLAGAFFIVISAEHKGSKVYAEDIVPTASPASIEETPGAVTGGAIETTSPTADPVETAKPELAPVSGVMAKKGANLTSATVSWTSYMNAIRYEVWGKTLKSGEYTLLGVSDTAAFQATKLKAGCTYQIVIHAIIAGTNGGEEKTAASVPVSVKLKPGKVKSFKALPLQGKIYLKWSKVKNISGYQLQRKVHIKLKGFKAKFSHLKNVKGAKKTSLKNVMLVRGMKYSYRIRTFKKIGKKKVYSDWTTVNKKKCK